MVDAAIKAGTSPAAPPATDEADLAMLSELAGLAMEMARGFQAQCVAALKAGDLDRAEKAETRFSNLFLGIRRAVALKAKLRQQREEAQRAAEDRRDRRQAGKDDRRQAVAQRLSRAIDVAVGKPEAKERLTTELWTRLTEDERIDADLADTVLPLETLILRLGRDIGLSRRALAAGLDPDGAKADRAGPQDKGRSPAAGPAAWASPPPEPPEPPVTESAHYCYIAAADLGLPGDGGCRVRIDTGEVFDDDDSVIMRLPVPDNPWGAGAADVVRLARAARADPGGAAPPLPEPDPGPPKSEDRGRRQAGGEWTAMQIIARSLGRYG